LEPARRGWDCQASAISSPGPAPIDTRGVSTNGRSDAKGDGTIPMWNDVHCIMSSKVERNPSAPLKAGRVSSP